jgi:hypothetical protein
VPKFHVNSGGHAGWLWQRYGYIAGITGHDDLASTLVAEETLEESQVVSEALGEPVAEFVRAAAPRPLSLVIRPPPRRGIARVR